MIEYVNRSKNEFGLNPLHHVIVPVYSYDCWLMSRGVTLDTLQDKLFLDDSIEAKWGGLCGIMVDRLISTSNINRYILYIDASNLFE